jgi:hypothetical protein
LSYLAARPVLDMFRETAMFCRNKIDVGVYNPQNR